MSFFGRNRRAERLPPAPRAQDIIRDLDRQLIEVKVLLGTLKTVILLEKGYPDAQP